MRIIIDLTDVELAALAHVMTDPQEWTENAIRERARIAMLNIVERETARMMQDPDITQIPASVDEIVLNAPLPEPLVPNPPDPR